jgi:hypothetical protein
MFINIYYHMCLLQRNILHVKSTCEFGWLHTHIYTHTRAHTHTHTHTFHSNQLLLVCSNSRILKSKTGYYSHDHNLEIGKSNI